MSSLPAFKQRRSTQSKMERCPSSFHRPSERERRAYRRETALGATYNVRPEPEMRRSSSAPKLHWYKLSAFDIFEHKLKMANSHKVAGGSKGEGWLG